MNDVSLHESPRTTIVGPAPAADKRHLRIS
jgi:hypothetical protein